MSLSGILGLEVDQLGDDQVRDLIVDRRAEEDDPLVEQTGVDVEGTLAARGLLDDHGYERAHWRSLRAGIGWCFRWSFSGDRQESRARVSPRRCASSFSGVQSCSRASASSGAIGVASSDGPVECKLEAEVLARILLRGGLRAPPATSVSTSSMPSAAASSRRRDSSSSSRHRDRVAVGERLERELAAQPLDRVRAELGLHVLERLAAQLEVAAEGDAALADGARERHGHLAARAGRSSASGMSTITTLPSACATAPR